MMEKLKAYIGTTWFKLLSVVVTIAFLTLLTAPISSYADQLNLTIGEATQYGSMNLPSPYGTLYRAPMKIIEGGPYNGTPVYCLDHDLNTPPDITYIGQGSVENNEISWIIKQNLNLSFNEAYFAKQAAISAVLGQVDRNNNFSLAYDSPVKTAILNLINGARANANTNPSNSVSLTLNPANVTLEYNSQMNEYVSPNINMNISGSLQSLQLGSSLPSNINVLLPNGQVINPNQLSTNDTNFRLVAATNSVNDTENGSLAIKGAYKTNVIYRYVPTQSGYQEMAVPMSQQVNGANLATLNANVAPAMGNIQIVKTGVNGVRLEGAKFEVLQNGNVEGTATTNSNGVANFNNLLQGQYQVKEVQAPAGYNLNTQVIDTTVKAVQTDTVNVTDQQITGKIQIVKTSENGKDLSGAKFDVMSGNKVVTTVTTNNNGIAETGVLPYGNYQIKEVSAPNGYNLNTNTFNTSIQTQNQVATVNIQDKIIQGQVAITKESAENNNIKLSNAQYTIYNAQGQNVDTLTTNDNGYAISKPLDFGKYTMKETKAPTGYLVNNQVYNIDIAQNGKIYNYTMQDHIIQGKIQVVKTGFNGQKLEGAKFNVLQNGNLVSTITTNNDGIAETGVLPYGNYQIKEVTAPNGYNLNTETFNTNIQTENQVATVNVQDKIIQGQVAITKVNAQNNNIKIAGAEYTIYNAQGQSVETLTTNNDGYAISKELNFGKYTMKETKAPTGYLVNNQVYNIDITQQGKVYGYNVQDQVIQGKVQIIKLDGNTSQPLANAKFGVYADNVIGVKAGTEVATLTTNADGSVTTGNLNYGTYTIKELEAPQGYYLNKDGVNVNITKNNKTYIEYVKDAPIQARLQVFKKDATNNAPLAGVQFEILNASTKQPVNFYTFAGTQKVNQTIFTTNAQGELMTPQALPYGNYLLKEVKADQGYNNLTGPISFSINANTNMQDIKLLGEVFTMNVTNSRITGKIVVNKENAQTGKPAAGAEFKVTCIDGFQKGKTWDITSNEQGQAVLDNAQYGMYSIQEIKAPTGYVLNNEVQDVKIVDNGKTVSVAVKDNEIIGKTEIIKTDATTGKPVAGAKIKVTCTEGFDKGQTWEWTTTNEAHEITLPYGQYTWQEVSAPTGYLLNKTIGNFAIETNGQVVKTNIQDQRAMGKAEIIKTDATTGKPVVGAKIKVTALTGLDKGQTWEWTSANEAHELSLPIGNYTWQEIDAPVGYQVNKTIGNFTVTTNGVTKANIVDQRIAGKAEIIKTDATTGKPVAGAKIKVTCTEGFQKGQTWEWTSTNEAHELNLEYGQYTWQEVDAPTGYYLNKTIGHFAIETNGQVVKANIQDQRQMGTSEIIKTDATTSKPVAGAKIKVTALTGLDKGQTWEWTSTNEAHKLSLPIGNYTWQEVDAPTGYHINKTIGNFTITTNGITKANIQDQREMGKAEIIKTDATTSKPVAGAKIKVTALTGLDKGQTWEWTSTNEAHELSLPIGNYTWQEIDAPTGYQINKTIGKFTIKDNSITKANIIDKRIEGKVYVSKIDATTGKLAAGAKIKVTCTEGLDKGQTWEWTSTNEAHELTLPYGNYTWQEIDAPTGYYLNKTIGHFVIETNGQIIKANIQDQREMGKAEIIKTDATTSKPVAGAKIKVTALTGLDKGQTWEWTSTNEAHELSLPIGNYTWQEVDAPTGYHINKTIGNFTITTNGITKANIQDQRKMGTSEIIKTDATTSKPVAGAKIKVTALTGLDKGQTWEWTTTNEAHKLSLPIGNYTWQEVDAPTGYQINKTIGKFTIKDNSITKTNIVDKRIEGKVYITKTDATTSKPVAGAKIKVTCTEGLDKGQTWEWTSTNEAHELTLPYGNYTWQEVDAPVGYDINKTIGHFDITTNGQIVKANIVDQRQMGKVEITKTDATTSKPVAGAKIKVTALTGLDKGQTWEWTTTDQAHQLTLPVGEYTWNEIDAPTGYQINKTTGHFTITNNGITKANIVDKRIEGTAYISKTNIDNGQLVSGAKILVTCTEGFQKGQTWEWTSTNEAHKLNLEYGTYTYKEVDAPHGFYLNNGVGTFTINKEGQVVKANISDIPVPVVHHKDTLAKTGQPVQNELFFAGMIALMSALGLELTRRKVFSKAQKNK